MSETQNSKHDDSGHCIFGQNRHFVPIFDDGQKVGICCTYCSYMLFEHVGNVYVTPCGELIEMIQVTTSTMAGERIHESSNS
jgi:hypothetical protein